MGNSANATSALGRAALSTQITKRAEAGFNLLELLIVMAIMVLMLALAVPLARSWWSELQVEMAASEVATTLRLARSLAVRHAARVAVRFYPDADGNLRHAIYRDGDGDGVRSDDIDRGVDKMLRSARSGPLGGVRAGIPEGWSPRRPGSRKALDRLDDPVRFGRSNMASFTAHGGASPGTIYLTDGRFHLFAVRVNNRSGKIKILRYDTRAEVWF